MSDNNIVDMNHARKKQKEKAKQEQKKNQNNSPGASGGKLTIFHWVQFILFLLLMGYMMTLCRGG